MLEGEGADELPRSAEHLALRAFALVAPVEGLSFRFVNRIPLERGLGSSAATIACRARRRARRRRARRLARRGARARAAARGPRRQPRARRLRRRLPQLAQRHRADAHAPPRDRPAARGDRRRARHAREHRGLARPAARVRLARRRGRRERAGRAARRRRRRAATPNCSRPRSTTGCTSRTVSRTRRCSRELRDDPVPGTAGVTLSGSGPSVVVWAAKPDAAAVADALTRVCPTQGPAPRHRRRKEPPPHERLRAAFRSRQAHQLRTDRRRRPRRRAR